MQYLTGSENSGSGAPTNVSALSNVSYWFQTVNNSKTSQ